MAASRRASRRAVNLGGVTSPQQGTVSVCSQSNGAVSAAPITMPAMDDTTKWMSNPVVYRSLEGLAWVGMLAGTGFFTFSLVGNPYIMTLKFGFPRPMIIACLALLVVYHVVIQLSNIMAFVKRGRLDYFGIRAQKDLEDQFNGSSNVRTPQADHKLTVEICRALDDDPTVEKVEVEAICQLLSTELSVSKVVAQEITETKVTGSPQKISRSASMDSFKSRVSAVSTEEQDASFSKSARPAKVLFDKVSRILDAWDSENDGYIAIPTDQRSLDANIINIIPDKLKNPYSDAQLREDLRVYFYTLNNLEACRNSFGERKQKNQLPEAINKESRMNVLADKVFKVSKSFILEDLIKRMANHAPHGVIGMMDELTKINAMWVNSILCLAGGVFLSRTLWPGWMTVHPGWVWPVMIGFALAGWMSSTIFTRKVVVKQIQDYVMKTYEQVSLDGSQKRSEIVTAEDNNEHSVWWQQVKNGWPTWIGLSAAFSASTLAYYAVYRLLVQAMQDTSFFGVLLGPDWMILRQWLGQHAMLAASLAAVITLGCTVLLYTNQAHRAWGAGAFSKYKDLWVRSNVVKRIMLVLLAVLVSLCSVNLSLVYWQSVKAMYLGFGLADPWANIIGVVSACLVAQVMAGVMMNALDDIRKHAQDFYWIGRCEKYHHESKEVASSNESVAAITLPQPLADHSSCRSVDKPNNSIDAGAQTEVKKPQTLFGNMDNGVFHRVDAGTQTEMTKPQSLFSNNGNENLHRIDTETQTAIKAQQRLSGNEAVTKGLPARRNSAPPKYMADDGRESPDSIREAHLQAAEHHHRSDMGGAASTGEA